jgi:butyrate kinase
MGFNVMSVYPTVSTTRLAVFDDEKEIRHLEAPHDRYAFSEALSVREKFFVRQAAVEKTLDAWTHGRKPPDAIIGCALLPAKKSSGVYILDDGFLKQMESTSRAGRIINHGALLASHAARALRVRAYALVPFAIDEMDAVYRISGIPGMNFGRLTHTLQLKNALHLASAGLGRPPEELSLVIAYLGKNFSFCSHSEGRIRDFSNSFERGPFSPGRSGSIPSTSVIRMAYSGMWAKIDLMNLVNFAGGVMSYTGTRDINEVVSRAESGDVYASMVIKALVYQIASEIASQATALCGKVDAIALIGKYAVNDFFADAIREKVSWISDRILTYGGEDELVTIAGAARRVLKGEETPRMCDKIPRRAAG